MSTPIKTLSFDQIYNLCNELGQPRYRADQLISCCSPNKQTTMMRCRTCQRPFEQLAAEDYPLVPARLIDRQVSSDGTRKYCFELADGARVEAVGIPSMQTNASENPDRLLFASQRKQAVLCSVCSALPAAKGSHGTSHQEK